jgi:hypothetical protein
MRDETILDTLPKVTFTLQASYEGTEYEPFHFELPGELDKEKWGSIRNALRVAMQHLMSQVAPALEEAASKVASVREAVQVKCDTELDVTPGEEK